MSNKTYIVSERSQLDHNSYELVWEWEEEMAKGLPNCILKPKTEFVVPGKPLRKDGKIMMGKGLPVMKIVEALTGFCIDSRTISKRDNIFRFEMTPRLKNNTWNRPNTSVVIIDFFLSPEQLPIFWERYSKVKHLYVSNLQVLHYLNENNPQRLVEHCPLSLPDRYAITKDTHYEKKYDVVMIGRQNPVLKGFLEKYTETHEISYVFVKPTPDGHFHAFTNKGEFVGNTDSREEYLEMMKKGKAMLYSTSGTDNDRTGTNGFHQVTPKFLEALACGCHVLSRFNDNEDTDFYELRRMSLKIESYDDFEKALSKALTTPVDMAAYAEYLAEHYTTAVSKKYLKGLAI